MSSFNLTPSQFMPSASPVPTGTGQFRELAASGQLSQAFKPAVDVDALMNVAYSNPMFAMQEESFGQFAV
jgi:hypothetical protein